MWCPQILVIIIIIILITQLVTHRKSIAVKGWIAGVGGLPWWLPGQVLSTIYCVCSVCVYTALADNCYSDPSWWQGNFFIRYHCWHHSSQYSCNATQTILNPSVPETVLIRDMNLRNTAEGGREPVTPSVAGKCVSLTVTVNRLLMVTDEGQFFNMNIIFTVSTCGYITFNTINT